MRRRWGTQDGEMDVSHGGGREVGQTSECPSENGTLFRPPLVISPPKEVSPVQKITAFK